MRSSIGLSKVWRQWWRFDSLAAVANTLPSALTSALPSSCKHPLSSHCQSLDPLPIAPHNSIAQNCFSGIIVVLLDLAKWHAGFALFVLAGLLRIFHARNLLYRLGRENVFAKSVCVPQRLDSLPVGIPAGEVRAGSVFLHVVDSYRRNIMSEKKESMKNSIDGTDVSNGEVWIDETSFRKIADTSFRFGRWYCNVGEIAK